MVLVAPNPSSDFWDFILGEVRVEVILPTCLIVHLKEWY